MLAIDTVGCVSEWSPERDLDAASLRADVVVRTLTDLSELDDARGVFDAVWPSGTAMTQIQPNLLKALVHAGASGVGTASIQIAKAIGARIAVTCSAGKAAACAALGADLVVERSPHEWLPEVKEHVPAGFDVVLDVIGGDEVDRNLQAVATKGTIVQVGLMGGGATMVNVGLLLAKRATWVGTTLRARPIEEKVAVTRRFAAEMLPLFDDGTLRPVIDSVYDFDQIADAQRHMESNANVGKILVRVAG